MIKSNIKLLVLSFLLLISLRPLQSAEMVDPIKVDWSFKGLTGTFDRASLQRGFQVYKAIAASFEIEDGPDSQGEMFTRPGKPSDKFKSPYPNVQAATAANGGAYPPDMSVLVKARKGGANYIYSVLVGYEDPPPGVTLDDGVYYNKYMAGNKIKMPNNLMDGLVEYADGTESTVDQMAKDVTTFLAWAAEPELEERHKTGVKVIIYLVLLTILVYLSMKKIWSRIDSEV